MLHKTAQIITEWSISKSENNKDKKVVEYGIELILETIIKFTVLLVTGAVIGKFQDTVWVLAAFSGIRASAGGWHAKTSFGCTGFMIMVVLGSIKMSQTVLISVYGCIVFYVIDILIILRYAPNGSQANKLLSERERRIKRNYALITLMIFVILSVLSEKKTLILTAVNIEILTVFVAGIVEERYGRI